MAKIETIYRAVVHYEADHDVSDAIQDRAFVMAEPSSSSGRKVKKVQVDAFTGNSCCNPYLTGESNSLYAVTAWAEKVERYVTRRRDATLLV